MRKPAVLFAAMALMADVVATFLWIELRAERELSAQLREHVVGLEARLQSGPIPEVQPEGRVAPPVSQAEPATVRVPDPAVRPVQLSAVAGLDCDRQWESQRQVAVRSPPELNLTAEEQQQYGRLYLRQLPLARVCQVESGPAEYAQQHTDFSAAAGRHRESSTRCWPCSVPRSPG